MSVRRSVSSDSSSSTNTASAVAGNDASNLLYNDRQNYQIIFKNDSRFFDTSLHLFKSYCDLGYVKSENEKSKRRFFSSSSSSSSSNTHKSRSNGSTSRWRPPVVGFSSNNDKMGTPQKTSKTPFLRNYGRNRRFDCAEFPLARRVDHSISHRSDPGSSKTAASKMKREKMPSIVPVYRQSMSMNRSERTDDSSDDPDIIVTRL